MPVSHAAAREAKAAHIAAVIARDPNASGAQVARWRKWQAHHLSVARALREAEAQRRLTARVGPTAYLTSPPTRRSR